jgi:hypothetical protein
MLSAIIPIGARCFYGPFPFLATLGVVEVIKVTFTAVLGITNVSVVLQLLFLAYFE